MSEDVGKREHKYKYTVGTGKIGKMDFYFDSWDEETKKHIKDLTQWYVQNIRVRFN